MSEDRILVIVIVVREVKFSLFVFLWFYYTLGFAVFFAFIECQSAEMPTDCIVCSSILLLA